VQRARQETQQGQQDQDSREAVETIIVGDWVVSAADNAPIRNGAVRIVGNQVTHVGTGTALTSAFPDAPVVQAAGRVIAPGFVNAHVHLYGVLAHGIPLHTPPDGFWGFLNDFWWPKVEDALDATMMEAATEWVCAEMLRSGTTSFYDITEAPNALPGVLLRQKAVVDRLGMRGVLSFEATERKSPSNGQAGLQENVDAIIACREDAHSLVDALMCVHTTFTCPPPFLEQAFALAVEHDVLLHAHVNEGVHEGLWCEENRGVRTLELYDQLGIASSRLLASQCVQLSQREREIIAERGVRAVHMPLANCEVGGGIALIPELREAGVTVGLGSDGYINDFFAVMRGAFLLHKARLLDPGAMPAHVVFGMATEGGARALGLTERMVPVGRLEPGWAADLQLIRSDFPTPATEHNLFDQLVLWRDSRHVTDVMVNGTWRVRDCAVAGFDHERSGARVHEQANRLWAH
jgi:5-methylthioadenosine/S-adenosylhomocysteine deaminase